MRFHFNSLGHRTPEYQNDVLVRGQRVRVVGRADRRLHAARRRRPAHRAGPRPRHARAMAHLGVLRVLRRARVTVAGVAGTSVDGVIGGHAGQRPRRGAAGRPLRRRRRLGALQRMRADFSRHLPRIRAARNKERFFHGSPLADLSDSDT
jgi:hypothetical protein